MPFWPAPPSTTLGELLTLVKVLRKAYAAEPLSSPSEPNEARSLKLSTALRSGAKKPSSDMRQPSDTEGKKPQRRPETLPMNLYDPS